MTRNGKIARLPQKIREVLNGNIQNGEIGSEIVDWLNSEPLVQRVLKEHFGGRPINEQNLSEWKNGGYVEWLARQEFIAQARELAEDASFLNGETGGRLADHLATVLAARYAAVLTTWNGQVTEEFEKTLRVLHALGQDIALLRRGEHGRARLAMEEAKLEWKLAQERRPTIDEIMRTPTPLDWLRRQEIENAELRMKNEKKGGIESLSPQSEQIRANQTSSNLRISESVNQRVEDKKEIKNAELKIKNGPAVKTGPPPADAGIGGDSEPIKPNQTSSNLRNDPPSPGYGGQGESVNAEIAQSEGIGLNQTRAAAEAAPVPTGSEEQLEGTMEELLRERDELQRTLQTMALQNPKLARELGIKNQFER